jgi:hypothetical protein
MTWPARTRMRVLTGALHFLQPLARIWGRLRHGLTPWRRRGRLALAAPWGHRWQLWSERWVPASGWLSRIETALRAHGADLRRGSAFDEWDMELRSGLLAGARLRVAVEEHGQGKQLLRVRAWPRWSPTGTAVSVAAPILVALAVLGHKGPMTLVLLLAVTLLLAARLFAAVAVSLGAFERAFADLAENVRRSNESSDYQAPALAGPQLLRLAARDRED